MIIKLSDRLRGDNFPWLLTVISGIMTKVAFLRPLYLVCFLFCALTLLAQSRNEGAISGRVVSHDKQAVEYATVQLKGTSYGSSTTKDGLYHITAPAGKYTLVASAIGYDTEEKQIELKPNERVKMTIRLREGAITLDDVQVVSTGVNRVKNSAYNAVAIDTKDFVNTSKTLSDALAKAPGVKLRESGGVGSDMSIVLDGFSGKYVKIFIDGVPQEGAGTAFDLNNLPVNFAERIEVYKGVVPVGFGTDAIGGVVNIVTNKKRRKWFVDGSYSYGSFNTHKTHINFGQTFRNGLFYEVTAFQNYSDNDYYINNKVYEFDHSDGSSMETEDEKRVKRFNDTFHNEAIVGKIGVRDKSWADRLSFDLSYSHFYKEIQTGVRQRYVFGEKHRHGYSWTPSLEYSKRDLLLKGLSVIATLNYNYNITTNVDTAMYKYNWYGDRLPQSTAGEQNLQYSDQKNTNWNATVTANYRIARAHSIVLNHVFNRFERTRRSLIPTNSVLEKYDTPNELHKNITGLSYRFIPSEAWNLTVFGKYYNAFSRGSVSLSSTDVGQTAMVSRNVSSWGYGVAGTYYILKSLQAKASYEKALRMPSTNELFGDGDLEAGQVTLKPENSHNVNVNLSYTERFGQHAIYAEGGLIYRDTHDYIKRTFETLAGNAYGTYENHGRVETKGYNLSLRYTYSRWVNLGGTFTQMDARDKEKQLSGSTGQYSTTYGQHIPNQPYRYANFDINGYWHDLFGKGNVLSLSWESYYQHEFPLYWENFGAAGYQLNVPTQFSHNITLGYSVKNGRYNFTLECHNLFDEKLYDNYSLQKAGRAFYGKVRVYLGK